MHKFNRFFLLGTVLFSFIAPLFVIYIQPSEYQDIVQNGSNLIQPLANQNDFSRMIEQESYWTFNKILLMIYAAVAFLMTIRFIKNLIDISFKIYRNQHIQLKSATLILVKDPIVPHTFWKYIFINELEFQENEIEDELYTHELTHVTQRHTIDVILIELLQIILWFNPFIIWLKKAVQLNHEFLADDNVVSSHHNISYYQTLLLNKAAWNNKFYLASNLNYSLTKKRLLMMKTPSSKLSILLKKLLILPLLICFVFVFAERVEAQTKEKKQEKEITEKQRNASKKEMQEYQILLKYAEDTKIFKQDDIKRMSIIYNKMSFAQRKEVKDIHTLIPPPPKMKLTPKPISEEKFNELKDKSKYAVWIDGKVVDNQTLNHYKATDFASHFGSYVYRNARSKKFPQEYQYNLYTPSYFEKVKKSYREYAENYPRVKEEKRKKETNKPIPVKIEVRKNNENTPPPPTKDEVIEVIEELPIEEPAWETKFIEGETIDEIVEKPANKEIQTVKTEQSPKIKFNKGWYITIDDEKYYYTFDKKERIARYYRNGKLVNLDIVKEYQKKYKRFENLKSQGRHYIFKSNFERQKIDQEFSDLGGMYFRMSRNDKNKVNRPTNPRKPYIKLITEKGKVYYKLRSELTKEDQKNMPPPPPRPSATKKEKEKSMKLYKQWAKRLKLVKKN